MSEQKGREWVEKCLLFGNFFPFNEKQRLFPGVPDFSLVSHWPGLGQMTTPQYKEGWEREDLTFSASVQKAGKEQEN